MLDTYAAGMEVEAGATVGEDVALPPVSPHDFSAYPAQLLYSVRAAFFSNAERASVPAASNFLKSARWSPDGACLLTNSDDNALRLFDVPADALVCRAPAPQCDTTGDMLRPSLCFPPGESVYDTAWFPGAQATDPPSCVFAATSRAHPVQLWDAINGSLRCTFRAFDAADEITAAYGVTFSTNGAHVVAGYEKAIRIFDTSRPGRDCTVLATWDKAGRIGQAGIVSCFAFNPDRSGVFAAGAYDGSVALYDVNTGEQQLLMHGHSGGVTHVRFSPDGNYLYTGARRDDRVLCWDVRASAGVVYALHRSSECTNQRLGFDIEPGGRHLLAGGTDGLVRVFDLTTGSQVASLPAASDTVGWTEVHPYAPLVVTASGHRQLEAEDAVAARADAAANALRVWRFAVPKQ